MAGFNRSWRIHYIVAVCFLTIFAMLQLKSSTHLQNPSWTRTDLERTTGHGKSQPSTAVVVAALKKDDVSWIDFAWWDVWKYEVDNPAAKHAVPANKGHEAMVYLTHVVNEYDNLADRTIFIHADRYQWHNDDPRYDGKNNLQNLRLDFLDEQGYLNLRCHWFQGCPSSMNLGALNLTIASPLNPFNENPEAELEELYAATWSHLFPNTQLPEHIGAACCSQFAVTRDAIRANKKEEYVKIRKWLLDTNMEDYMSGRVLEYMWHILFGKSAVHCPSAEACYCNTYGMCHLQCAEGDCGVYQYPFNIPRLKTIWWELRHAFG